MKLRLWKPEREDVGGHGGPPTLPVQAWAGGICIAIVLFIALGASSAFADDPTSEQQLQVERQLGCPVCTNLPLNVCDNKICVQMKGVIHQKLVAGESPSQIVDYFVTRYGDGVLLTPPVRGFNLAVWYAPGLVVLLGVVVVWLLLRESIRRQRIIASRLSWTDPGLEEYRNQVRRDIDGLGKQP